jgi:hypothetical protein
MVVRQSRGGHYGNSSAKNQLELSDLHRILNHVVVVLFSGLRCELQFVLVRMIRARVASLPSVSGVD